MSDLKLCPFCGGDARVQKVNAIVGVKFTVCCGNCYCMGHETTYLVSTREKAVEAWNKRANDCDREALLALAKDLDDAKRVLVTGKHMEPMEAAKRIRKACGVVE